ncbi:dienelactone hydrolase family protein [Amycolatopsis sp. YIM 10]|uniref:dienelactone hydrolase family protein n=1 Tax=Amycolatopsis sp. YIM 10 TaxID=2653857 RepID=UPI0012908057|nr:alpha/beta family hydrolase [Amycolatopsis sp. YIM 10]QFU89896.1 Putative phosphoribosyl transferase [Amycolatopsis sp. YIM 10]
MRAIPRPVTIGSSDAELAGDLAVPEGARAVVVFAHGSGSSRRSHRNRAVAEALQDNGFATLLLDLLTEREELADRRTGHLRFDIPVLADRLVAAVEQVGAREAVCGAPIGLFGASTGAAAALVAAARVAGVRAVVSRGGRPDLAGDALEAVRAPALLIVGGDDVAVLDLNQRAAGRLGGPNHIEIVPGATHLFEEPGALAEVARLASDWFGEYLVK